MGRFTAFNQFSALGLFSRRFLNSNAHYEAQAQRVATLWPGNLPFVRGTKIDEYLSEPVRDPYVQIL
jgi:hypothetical protein